MGCRSSKNLANPEPLSGEGKEQPLQRGHSSHPVPNFPEKKPESVAHGFDFDVFLTHDWGQDCNGISNHERVAKLNRYLKMKGERTWFDDEQMEGNVVDKMSDGIDRSALIVVCITKRYVEKVTGLHSKNDNCRAEFTYARSKKTAEGMIPVVMERRMMDSKKWGGSVGMTLGEELYCKLVAGEDGVDTDSIFDEQCEKIYRYIQTRKFTVYGVAAQESGWTVDPVPQPLVGTQGTSDAEEAPTNLVCATPAAPSNKEVSSPNIVTQAEGGQAQNHHEAGPGKAKGGKPEKEEHSPSKAKREAEGQAHIQAQQSDKECKEILELKLADVTAPLELKQSIDLLCYCIRAGESRAAMLDGKETLILIGNTGAGKSTLGNYLAGCTLIKKEAGEDSEHENDVIVVQGICDGGKMDEVTPIGHTSSKTFMPEIFQCPDSFMFCDCPGFLDTRGAEINIGNAVNIKAALSRALNARVIVLINYHSIMADRSHGVAQMLAICSHLFGSEENVKRYKESIMLCVTYAPSGDTVEKIRRMLLKGAVTNSSIMKDLVERIFLYCPLDSGPKDRLSRDAILRTVRDIQPIPDPSSIFQTVLKGDDENRLIAISHEMGKAVAEALEGRDFFRAAEMVSRLQNLVVIDHATVKRLLDEAWERVRHFFRSAGDKVKADCHFTRFDKARDALEVIEAASHHFERDVTAIHELREWYESSSTMHRERLQRDQELSKQLMAAHNQVQELSSLLQQQQEETKRQLKEQEERFEQLRESLEQRMQQTVAEKEAAQNALKKELADIMTRKDAEIRAAAESEKGRLEKERESLKKEFESRLEEASQMTEAAVAKQAEEKARMAAEHEENLKALRLKMSELELQRKEAEHQKREEEQARLRSEPKEQEETQLELTENGKQGLVESLVSGYDESNNLLSRGEYEAMLRVLVDEHRPDSSHGRFSIEPKELIIGTNEDAAHGLLYRLGADEDDVYPKLRNNQAAIEAMREEVAKLGDPVVSEHLRYVLDEEASEKEYPNGIRDRGHVGKTLKDFAADPNAVAAKMTTAEAAALRLYTTMAFKVINDPLRDTMSGKPHPLPVTVMLIARGLRKLRSLGAYDSCRTQTQVMFRSMRYIKVSDAFMKFGGTELAPMSTTPDIRLATRYGMSDNSLMFYIKTKNNLQRGVDIDFLSFFPAGGEILFPPLTFLQPTGKVQEVKVMGMCMTIVETEPTFG